jgi:drug/metabolite transporter (DMT)-like permease
MLKTFGLVVIAVVIGGTGHVLLSRGMRSVGDLTDVGAGALAPMIRSAASSPWVLLGVVLQAVFFLTYLVLLSRTDVSQLLPLTALDYVVVALLAHAFLDEAVTPVRWAGIACVVVGVYLVARS